MQFAGILRSWNDDRGFGFIAPTHGGAELFVHISAFPRDGSRPVEGESLTYELGRGRDGKPQAVRVTRQAIGAQRPRPQATVRRARSGSPLRTIALLLLAVTCLAYAYKRLAKPAGFPPATASEPMKPAPALRPPAAMAAPPAERAAYRCDGRTYCSQMTSCAEANYFLKNCPGVKMDGNHDGVPCQQQWCR